jgi:hypothetical protein
MNLKTILDDHKAWLAGDGGCRANLTGEDLTGANLREANLTRAHLTGTDLTGANLTRAHLTGTDLTGANLRGANLTGTDLTGTDLTGANLRGANLYGTDLTRANLRGAEGVLVLPISEPRCYRHIAVLRGSEWVIFAGCRWFTVAEARSHWCSDDYRGPASVRETYPAALEWLAKQQQVSEDKK